MKTVDELSTKATEICLELLEYETVEVLQILSCINFSAVGALYQNRTFEDVILNGFGKK